METNKPVDMEIFHRVIKAAELHGGAYATLPVLAVKELVKAYDVTKFERGELLKREYERFSSYVKIAGGEPASFEGFEKEFSATLQVVRSAASPAEAMVALLRRCMDHDHPA